MKMPRLRFSILSLLVLTAVIACSLMFYQRHLAWKQAERDFREILHTLGEQEERASKASKLIARYPQLARQDGVMIFAADTGDVNFCRQCLEAGADPNERTESGQLSAIFWPTYHGQIAIVKLLIEHGADIDVRFPEFDLDRTLLHIATRENNYEVCQLLIDAGIDVNAVDKLGNTPLHLAAYNRHDRVVQLLLNAGAESRLNKNGQTPREMAIVSIETFILEPDEEQVARQIADMLPRHDPIRPPANQPKADLP